MTHSFVDKSSIINVFLTISERSLAMIGEGEFKKARDNWGLVALITVYDCKQELITNQTSVKQFVNELCSAIKMERHREPLIDRFGSGVLEGVSCVQLIKTSSVTVHCDEILNRVFIDIFSCKWFNQQDAAFFCMKFFNAKKYQLRTVIRA